MKGGWEWRVCKEPYLLSVSVLDEGEVYPQRLEVGQRYCVFPSPSNPDILMVFIGYSVAVPANVFN